MHGDPKPMGELSAHFSEAGPDVVQGQTGSAFTRGGRPPWAKQAESCPHPPGPSHLPFASPNTRTSSCEDVSSLGAAGCCRLRLRPTMFSIRLWPVSSLPPPHSHKPGPTAQAQLPWALSSVPPPKALRLPGWQVPAMLCFVLRGM